MVLSGTLWTIIGLAALGTLAYWYFDERQQTETAAETVENVGSRAETVTGGFVGAIGSLLVVVASIAVTIGTELMSSAGQLGDLLGNAPLLVGHVLAGVLGYLGISGLLSVQQWGFAFILVTIVALFLKYGD